MKKIPLKESEIQRQILDWLTWQPDCFAFRTNNIGIPLKGGGFRPSPVRGLPDIIIILMGWVIFVEVKTAKGIQSEAQKGFQTYIENAGGNYILVRSLEDLQTHLKQGNYGK